MSSEETIKFKDAYDILKTTATAMQGDIDDVDEVLAHVKTGVNNYSICKARIDYAQAELSKLLENSKLPTEANEAALRSDSSISAKSDVSAKAVDKNDSHFDEDIPF